MEPAAPDSLAIGEWRIDAARDQMSRGNETIKLEPRAMRLLLYLAEHSNRVVGIQELLDHIWANVVVTPQSVYNVVGKLRQQLGDTAALPTHIATIPRKGYQLVAPIRRMTSPAAGAASVAPVAVPIPEANENVGTARPDPSGSAVVPAGATEDGGAGQSRRLRALRWAAAAALLGSLGLLLWYALDRSPASVTRAVPSTEPSVAVLPFIDMTESKDQQYLADGMTEELINKLAQIRTLRVPARTSAFYFKGRQFTVGEVGKALGVDHVLEGSVRKSGDRFRITVQLVDTQTGYHLWSRTYDRSLADILDLESDVAAAVADQFRISLLADERTQMAAGGTRNSEAFEAYLRGEQRLLGAVDRQVDTLGALAFFERAIELDPAFALPYSGKARALDTLAVFHADSKSRDEVRAQALAAGQKAIELAPNVGEAHVALAITRAYGLLDFSGAAPEFEKAVSLSPGNARVLRLYAEFASSLGHHERAITTATRAAILDPENVGAYVTLGRAYAHARRFPEALAALHDAEKLNPASNFVEGSIMGTLLDAQENARARALCESASVRLDEDNRYWCLAFVYHRLGRTADAEQQLQRLQNRLGDAGAFSYAEVYADWGDHRRALDWLGKAARARAPEFQGVRVNPKLDPLRGEPEFKLIEKAMNLPQ